MIAKLTFNVKMCSIFMHRTVLKHLLLLQPRYVCAHKMAYSSLTGGWMEIKFNINLQQYTTLLLTSLYMLHTSMVGVMSSERAFTSLHFTACLLINSCTDVNIIAEWWCTLPYKTCILESLGDVGLHSDIIPKRFLKFRSSFLIHTHYVTHSLHIIVHIWQDFLYNSNSNIFTFNIDSFFLSEIILDANNKRANCQLFMSQSNRSRNSWNTETHIATITAYVTERLRTENKNININDNFHFTPHS
jgi:hypothetical protein